MHSWIESEFPKCFPTSDSSLCITNLLTSFLQSTAIIIIARDFSRSTDHPAFGRVNQAGNPNGGGGEENDSKMNCRTERTCIPRDEKLPLYLLPKRASTSFVNSWGSVRGMQIRFHELSGNWRPMLEEKAGQITLLGKFLASFALLPGRRD